METINNSNQPLFKKQSEDSKLPPMRSGAIDMLLSIGAKDNPLVKEYLAKLADYQADFQNMINALPKKKIDLPDLKPISIQSLYEIFKVNFAIVNGKEFDETANGGESRSLAVTLCAYFLKMNMFLKSPILNREKNIPSLEKGLMIIGSYGIGKSAVIETFHRIFKYAQNNPIVVKDIEGTDQFLGRYKIYFGFNTTNEVIKEFKGLAKNGRTSDDEYYWDLFWKKHNHGFRYYDDLMTERTLKDFGETVELFKDILEERYANKAKTMASMNYSGNSLDTTLDAISEKYGERIYDRFFEMFNIIELKGTTLRK